MFDELAPALRRDLARGALDATLARHGHGLMSLATVRDTQALLALLDTARPYSSARDGLLADLLRLYGRGHDGGVLAVLLHALLGSMVRLRVRLARVTPDRRECDAAILHAVVVSVEGFDPDRRSPHVQASLERDAYHRLWLAWRADRRRRAAHVHACVVAAHATEGIAVGDYDLDDLLGPREPPPRRDFDPEEVATATEWLRGLVTARVLRERDVVLLRRTQLQGETLATVAHDLGLHVEAAKKALQRARRSLRAHQERAATLRLSPRVAGWTLFGQERT